MSRAEPTRGLSAEDARRFLLRYHYLLRPASLTGEEGVDAVLQRLRCIQVDPLDVTGKNADLVLQSRIADYRPELLEQRLYGDCRYLEAWDKLRSIVPAEDWPGLTAYRERLRRRYQETRNPAPEVLDYVRGEIRRRSPLSSLDLEDRGTADWRWAPARAVRAALELMFDWGEIGIVGRQGNRKLYAPMEELLERAGVQSDGELQRPDRGTYLKAHIERRLRALGLAVNRSGDGWLGVDKITAGEREAALAELEAEGRVAKVTVDGVRAPCYLPGDREHDFCPGSQGETGAPGAAFIAPLDNILWDRRLVEELFGFAYRWEVYKPPQERKYGYYVLPVLYGDRFVARWEPRRRDGHLEIDGWWWESGVTVTPEMRGAIGKAMHRFLRFLSLEMIQLDGKLDAATEGFILETAAEVGAAVRRGK